MDKKPPLAAFVNNLETAEAAVRNAKERLAKARLLHGSPLPAFTKVNFHHEESGVVTSLVVPDTSPRLDEYLKASPDGRYLHDVIDHAAKMSRSSPSLGPRLVASKNDPEATKIHRHATDDYYASWVKAVHDWVCGDFVLQQPHRAAHKGLEALGLHIAQYRDNKPVSSYPLKQHPDPIHVLSVEHDWARLFKEAKLEGSEGKTEEWRLPFDVQVFEFAISGAAVIVCCYQQDHKGTLTFAMRAPGFKAWATDQAAVTFTSEGWQYITGRELIGIGVKDVNAGFDRLYDFLFAQIKAVTIMLETEVAEVESVRAPYKDNKPAKDKVQLPAYSHHVLRLSRKPRAARLPVQPGHEPSRRVRLHFRRGHWRHYSDHKTWIKWMLVGDPDLGFVDKEYRT